LAPKTLGERPMAGKVPSSVRRRFSIVGLGRDGARGPRRIGGMFVGDCEGVVESVGEGIGEGARKIYGSGASVCPGRIVLATVEARFQVPKRGSFPIATQTNTSPFSFYLFGYHR
jgi:hypothetical protein